ncbi:hypothetical protein COY27_06120 [Candidatus Woesearchaeota archaeon CG_4_10_14_0_2_um_filter_33_13]|nr:MAG: hypothetical protein COY27_06120 [Candidatus Woesearchaeota archaeon CG_4_10_14_0_2_um_filter_33_13]
MRTIGILVLMLLVVSIFLVSCSTEDAVQLSDEQLSEMSNDELEVIAEGIDNNDAIAGQAVKSLNINTRLAASQKLIEKLKTQISLNKQVIIADNKYVEISGAKATLKSDLINTLIGSGVISGQYENCCKEECVTNPDGGFTCYVTCVC